MDKWILGNLEENSKVIRLSRQQAIFQDFFNNSINIDIRNLPRQRRELGHPTEIIFMSASHALEAISGLVDKFQRFDWHCNPDEENFPETVIDAEDLFGEISLVFFMLDRLIDDVNWLLKIFYSPKSYRKINEDSCSRLIRSEIDYARKNISIPTNFLKHNHTHINSISNIISLDYREPGTNLPGFEFMEWKNDFRTPIHRPHDGVKPLGVIPFCWLSIAVLVRLINAVNRFLEGKFWFKMQKRDNRIISLDVRVWDIAKRLFAYPLYKYQDSVFDDNGFEIKIEKEDLDSQNILEGSLFYGWYHFKKQKIEHFGHRKLFYFDQPIKQPLEL